MAIIGSDPRKRSFLDQFTGQDQFANQAALDSLKQEAAQNQSPVPTFGSPTADMMQQGGADLSQYSGAPSLPQNDQFSPVQGQTTAQALDAGGANDFDLSGLADALASGGDDFKFNKPNMKAMTVGGGQGYESMAAQPVQPLSTAMGAITSPQQQMYGAQQQPQDINMMRRMLGLA